MYTINKNKWEYKKIVLSNKSDPIEELNKLGNKGWELISTMLLPSRIGNDYYFSNTEYYLKRNTRTPYVKKNIK